MDSTEDDPRDHRLREVLAAYYEAAGTGPDPDPREWIARHPDLADDLTRFFEGQDHLRRLAGPLRAAAGLPGAGASVGYFGDYELTGELARGGMGVVFEARQVSLNRPVALKMLLAGALASADDRRRFRDEAEAAANLDHPHIVPIFEVGEHDGLAYFSMKRLEGGSLDRRLADFEADPRASAALMVPVARAIHHAHQRGILHRDLKPSNILLDREGRPHVADFGLARRVGVDGALSRTGSIAGTPSYMAPEQADGRRSAVTTAADVYGLGAVLYALLVGGPPFRGASPLETIERARERAPEPPSGLNRRVDRDLETICLTALEKDPARRYPSAASMADDLDRWLRGEPIEARPVGLAERAWRWGRRNPARAALTAVVVLSAGAGAAGLAVSNRLIAHQRERAEAKARQSSEAIDQMLTRLSQSALLGSSRLDRDRRDLLGRALEYYQSLEAEAAADRDPALEARAARKRGEILAMLGRDAEAADAFRRTIALAGTPARRPAARVDAVKAGLGLARAEQKAGRVDEAIRAFGRALPAVEGLSRDEPTVADYRRDLGLGLQSYGEILRRAGRLADAEEALGRSVPILETLARQHPEEEGYHFHAGESLKLLGYFRVQRGDRAEALRLWGEALDHARAALKAKPYSPNYLAAVRDHLENRAIALAESGRGDEAAALLDESVRTGRTLAAEYPDVVRFRRELAQSGLNQAQILRGLGRADAARDAVGRSLELYRTLTANHPEAAEYKTERDAAERLAAELEGKAPVPD